VNKSGKFELSESCLKKLRLEIKDLRKTSSYLCIRTKWFEQRVVSWKNVYYDVGPGHGDISKVGY